jgi:hypothetical protein
LQNHAIRQAVRRGILDDGRRMAWRTLRPDARTAGRVWTDVFWT